MTLEQTKQLITKIKNHYQTFSINESKVKEWYKYLKKYDYREVLQELEVHLYSQKSDSFPTIYDLTSKLMSDDDKKKNLMEELIFKCPLCGFEDKMLNYDNHISRHNSINYIKSKEKYINRIVNEEKLFEMSQDEFNKFYNIFLKELLLKTPDIIEQDRIKKILED